MNGFIQETCFSFYPLPDDKILDLSKLVAFADDKFERKSKDEVFSWKRKYRKIVSMGHMLVRSIFLLPLYPFPNNPWFLRVCSTSLLKTLC